MRNLYNSTMSGVNNTVRFGRFRLFGKMESQDDVLFERFAAVKEGSEKKVEIRILSEATKKGAPLTKRFIQELKILSSVKHPHVLSVLEVGHAEGRAFFTTPFRPSLTLERYVAKRGKAFQLRHVVNFSQTLANALSALHKKQIIHRTLSTESVFVDVKSRKPYIGECSAIQDLRRKSVSAYGVPQLAALVEAPEQLKEEVADERTDVYLLCAIVYWMLTGNHPLIGPNESLVFRHKKGGIVPLELPSKKSRVLGVDEKMDAIVMRGLSFDRAKRYGSAMEFAEALKTVAVVATAGVSTEIDFKEEILPLTKGLKSSAPIEKPLPTAKSTVPSEPRPNISNEEKSTTAKKNVPSLALRKEKKPSYQLFSQWQVFLGTLVGGVLCGATLMAINFRRLHFKDDIGKTFLWGFLFTIVIVAATVLVTPFAWSAVVPISIIIFYLTGSQQGAAMEKHKERKGKFAPWWQLPFVALLALSLSYGFAIASLAGAKSLRPNYVLVHGNKVKFKNEKDRERAEKLAKSLADQGYLSEDGNAVISLVEKDGSYIVSSNGSSKSKKHLEKVARHTAADVFAGKRFAFEERGNSPQFKPLRLIKIGGNRFYYNKDVPHSAARRACDFFESVGLFVPFSNWRTRLEWVGGRYHLYLTLRPGLWRDENSVNYFKALAHDLTKKVFQNRPIDLHLGDKENSSRQVVRVH